MNQNSEPGRRLDPMARAQLGLVLVVLGVCAFLPRPSGAVLLVTVGQASARVDPGFLAGHGLRLLGQGRWPGSLLVHAEGALPLGALVGRGVVPIGVPAMLCGPGAAPAAPLVTYK